jgi:hypothetical protein
MNSLQLIGEKSKKNWKMFVLSMKEKETYVLSRIKDYLETVVWEEHVDFG